MDTTYVTPKAIAAPAHKCQFRLEIVNGAIIAVCYCGNWFDYNEILRRINAQ